VIVYIPVYLLDLNWLQSSRFQWTSTCLSVNLDKWFIKLDITNLKPSTFFGKRSKHLINRDDLFRKCGRVFSIEENVTYIFKDKWKESSRDSRREDISNGYLSGISVAIVLMYTQSTSSTWVKSVLLFVTLVFVPHNLCHGLSKWLLTHPFCAAMLMAQTRSKIIFLRPKVSQYTEKKFPALIFMA